MNKKTIGIPKAFLYYRYGNLWTKFFENLGHNVILSEDTTKEIIKLGQKYSVDESCLPSKIYMGHVATLKSKCDYILIPRIDNYGKKERVCVKFNANYDLVKNLFEDYQILNYNIEKTKYCTELIGLFKIGIKLNRNPLKVIKSYYLAKIEERKQNKKRQLQQAKILAGIKPKILIVSHPYNIYDNYIGSPIIDKLTNLGFDIIYADKLEPKLAKMYAKTLSPTLYWTYSKEIIGSVGYYRYAVDGIIFLTTFPCGPDSLVNELILRKTTDIPVINILIDELTTDIGLYTRLESFADIIKERKEPYA